MKSLLLTLVFLVSSAAAAARAENLDASAQDGSAFFDGADRYAAASAQAPSPQDKAVLLAELKTRVTINDRGSPREGAALNAMLARLMDSPTARAKAAQFIKEDARAVISFEEIPNTVISEVNGRKDFATSGGHSHTKENPPEVHLNSAYLEARTESVHKTLAHELFGHTLEEARAARSGVADVNDYSQEDEANAGLVGWTVSAELGNKITDGWAWIYMADPQDYHKRLKSNLAYYAGTLSAEEMKAPQAVYEKRLADVEKILLRLPARKQKNETWLARIAHLIDRHGAAPAPFLTLKEEISATLAGLPGDEADLREIKEYLQSLIEKCGGESGAAWTGNLAAKSDNAYFRERAREMEERRTVLAGLMQGQTQQSQMPPERPGQITWDRLAGLWEQDTASGCKGI